MKQAVAAEVHLRLSSPEIRWPCFSGIDIPTRQELISNHLTPGEIAETIGANSVRFLSLQLLRESIDAPDNFCYSCFSGRYALPVPPTDQELTAASRDQPSPAEQPAGDSR